MPAYLLHNYYRYRKLIRYDTDSGTYADVDPNTLSDDERKPRPGAWVDIDGDRYGVSPSPGGPVFFHNQHCIELVRGAVETAIYDDKTKDGEWRRFTLTNEGERVVDVIFQRDPLREWDLYEGEANEFFEWFHDLHGRPHAWDLWTRPADGPWTP